MRVPFVFLILLACIVGAPPTASAEKAKATEAAKVYSRAGEAGKVILKIAEGQVMRIDRKEGRWYKVRVKGRTGWIPRSKVKVIEEEEIARNTRRRPFVDGRGTKRGFGGSDEGPSDRVGADAVDPDTSGGGEEGGGEEGDDPPKKPKKPKQPDPEEDGNTEEDEPTVVDEGDEPEADTRPRVRVTGKATIYSEASEDSDEADWKVKEDALLFPTGKKGKFTEVENDSGDIGFILTSKVEAVDAGEISEEDGDGGSKRPSQIDVRGRLGVTIIQQGLRSNSEMRGVPDNYNLSTSAATIALGGAYMRPYKARYVIGADVNFDLAKAVPGLKEGDGTNTGLTLYHLNVRAMFGYDLKRKSGMMVFGRLGLRWQSFQISNVTDLDQNSAKLPSEILTAPSIGAALAIPRLTRKVGLRFSLDAVVAGASLKQTKNLEDGNGKVKGAIAGAGFIYRWKPNMDINATYDLNFAKYNFGTPPAGSMRGHMGTGVTRTDLFHSVTVGVAKAF